MNLKICSNCGYNNGEDVSVEHPCARCSYTKSPAEHDADEAQHEADRVAAAKELFPAKTDEAKADGPQQPQAEVPATVASGPMPPAEASPAVEGVAVLPAAEPATV